MRKKTPAEIRALIQRERPRSDTVCRYLPSAGAASHQMHEYLHLVAQLGASCVPVPPVLTVTAEEAKASILKFGLDEKPLHGKTILGLCPGAEYGPAKRWPLQKFIAAAQAIQKRTDCVWLILGAQSDVPLANSIESALRDAGASIKNFAGKTSLRELMALLKVCRAVLTNDTGPMHVAAAVGTPVIVPFGSTSPELTGPGLPGDLRHQLLQANVPCAPCFLRSCPIDFRCMESISVQSVVEAMVDAIGMTSPAPAQRQK